MHKEIQARYIQNPLFDEKQEGYLKNKKVRSQIKKSYKPPLTDITNDPSSDKMISKQKHQNAKVLKIQISEESEEDCISERDCGGYDEQETVNETILSNQKIFVPQKVSAPQKIIEYQKEQEQDEPVEKIQEKGKKKNLFNFTFQDSSDSEEGQVELNTPVFEIPKESNCPVPQLNNFKNNQKLKKLLFIDSDSESEQGEEQQIQMEEDDGHNQKSNVQVHKETVDKISSTNLNPKEDSSTKIEQNPQKKKFFFDDEELMDSDDDLTENAELNARQHIDKNQIIKKVNISYLKSLNPYSEFNENSLITQKYHHLINMPIPNSSLFSMMVKRNQDENQYVAYDDELVRHVMTIRKSGSSYKCYARQREQGISSKDRKKSSKKKLKEIEIGKIKTNFLGTEFHCYLPSAKDKKSSQKRHLISIRYETNFLGLNGPRKITVYTPKQQLQESTSNLMETYDSVSNKQQCGIRKFVNKTPQWSVEDGAYVLDFKGRATKSSVKNCIIVDEKTEQQSIVFGKVSKDICNLDVRQGCSIIQGMVLAVSSFEKKLGCE